jgi:hypothetical protein
MRSPRVLQRANQRETERVEWGQFNFGPAIDGEYVRDLPGRELLHDNHVKNVSILLGHNEYVKIEIGLTMPRDEGLIFVDPKLMMASDRETRKKLRQNFPIAPLSILQKIRGLYPSPAASEGEFENQFDRINALISGPSSFCFC